MRISQVEVVEFRVQASGRPTDVFVPGHWQAVTPEGALIIPPHQGTVPGTGASERRRHHDSALCRAQPECSKQIHSDWY